MENSVYQEKIYGTWIVYYRSKKYGWFSTKIGAEEWLKDRLRGELE